MGRIRRNKEYARQGIEKEKAKKDRRSGIERRFNRNWDDFGRFLARHDVVRESIGGSAEIATFGGASKGQCLDGDCLQIDDTLSTFDAPVDESSSGAEKLSPVTCK